MTTDTFYSRWVLFSRDKKRASLDRLKADKDDRWEGEELQAVNDLVERMESHLKRN